MTESTTGTRTHKAGIFDIRFIIGALLGIYGLITLLAGFFTSDADIERSDGLNINIVAGIGMLVVAAGFAAWARLRPIVVPAEPEKIEDPDKPEHLEHPERPGQDPGGRPAGH
jgi:hypothetical protein